MSRAREERKQLLTSQGLERRTTLCTVSQGPERRENSSLYFKGERGERTSSVGDGGRHEWDEQVFKLLIITALFCTKYLRFTHMRKRMVEF